MGLLPAVLQSLDSKGFTTPTPIQAGTIPFSLAGKDILGSAKTGTGKTLSFAIPLISHLMENAQGSGLVLVPTRELAQQVEQAIRQIIPSKSNLKTALLIGGEAIAKQFSQLRANPRIVIGTPGRIIDHLKRKTFKSNTTSFLVLDETDRMFDMGFGIQLEEIIKTLPKKRQTVMFSATFAPKIEALAAKYLIEPERVFMDEEFLPAENLTQETIKLNEADKYSTLVQELEKREGSIIVFVKTKHNADRLAVRLMKENHSASAIHGDLRQNKRERVMHAFRQGRYRIMVATDVAARGLDVPHVQHVINYDIPHAPEDYIHRIGRTARAGASGEAISFLSSADNRRWAAIQRLLNPSANDGEDKRPPHTLRKNKGKGESRGGRGDRFDRGDRKPRRDGESRGEFRAKSFGKNRDESRGDFGSEKKSFKRDGEFRVVGGEKRTPRAEGEYRAFAPKRSSKPDGEFRKFDGEKRAPRAANSFGGGFGGEKRAPRVEGESRSDSRGGFGAKKKSFNSDKSYGDKPSSFGASKKPSFGKKPFGKGGFDKAPGKFGAKPAAKFSAKPGRKTSRSK